MKFSIISFLSLSLLASCGSQELRDKFNGKESKESEVKKKTKEFSFPHHIHLLRDRY